MSRNTTSVIDISIVEEMLFRVDLSFIFALESCYHLIAGVLHLLH